MQKRPFRSPPSALIIGLYRHGFAWLLGRLILLLTTTGRKTGFRASPRCSTSRWMACIILAQRVDQKPIGSAISSPTGTCACRLNPGICRQRRAGHRPGAHRRFYRVAPAPPPAHAGDDPQVGRLAVQSVPPGARGLRPSPGAGHPPSGFGAGRPLNRHCMAAARSAIFRIMPEKIKRWMG